MDLEHVNEMPEAVLISQRFFSEGESSPIQSLRGKQRTEAFYKVWAGKEAVLELCGSSLGAAMSTINIHSDPRTSRCLVVVEEGAKRDRDLLLYYVEPAAGLIAAVATESSNSRLSCRRYVGIELPASSGPSSGVHSLVPSTVSHPVGEPDA